MHRVTVTCLWASLTFFFSFSGCFTLHRLLSSSSGLTNDEIMFVVGDDALVATMDSVILEHVLDVIGVNERVVDGHDLWSQGRERRKNGEERERIE